MEKKEIIFDGKEKRIFATDSPDEVIIHFKDMTTAFGGIKRASLKEKGVYNSRICAIVFKALEDAGIKTHFISEVGPREILCRKVELIPLQIIVRNRLAGTTADLLGVENGTRIANTVYELRYNNDALSDPMINEHHAVALGLVTYEEAERLHTVAARVNEVLKALYAKAGIELVDFKMECGRLADGSLVVSDEISPDNSRLWDIATGEILDKDRFRHDMSDVCISYKKVMTRLEQI